MSCLEHKGCLAWNTGNVQLGTQPMSCLEHRACHAWLFWNTRNGLPAAQGKSCLEHRECLAWNAGNVLLGTQGMSCLKHSICDDDTKVFCHAGFRYHSYKVTNDTLPYGGVYFESVERIQRRHDTVEILLILFSRGFLIRFC